MLTISDIDAMHPDEHLGSVFSDLHKDAYGFRPGHITFRDMADFDEQWARAATQLKVEMEREEHHQAFCRSQFEIEVEAVMVMVVGCEIIRDAEGLGDEYGWEELEYKLNLGFGYIEGTL
jgi:hypothetical protein